MAQPLIRVAVIGTGHVGLTTAVCLAELGAHVTGLDIDKTRVRRLRKRQMPFFEPGLAELFDAQVEAGRLDFTDIYAEAIPGREFIFLAVGTPTREDGQSDLSYLINAATELAGHLDTGAIVVNKSTVPIGTGDIVAEIINKRRPEGPPARVVSNPEFLREGSAIQDLLRPDRIVFGAYRREDAEHVATLYRNLTAPRLFTDPNTAEMIKYASNAFLATRISFINEIGRICERVGADIAVVSKGIGLDHRIGPQFLDAGLGYGGSCFPKDVLALAHRSEEIGSHPQLLHAVLDINRDQRRLAVEKLAEMVGGLKGKRIAILGLAFKPDTDDLRDAPALDVITGVLERHGTVVAYDPRAMQAARPLLDAAVELASAADGIARDADALVIATDWPEFHNLDLAATAASMRQAILLDGRNMFDPATARAAGFRYAGMGR